MPVHVADDERILRAIYSPYHLDKKNNLKHQAYDPTPRTDEVSVMRLEHMGAVLCKRRAKSIENPAQRKAYRGFAVLRTRSVRASQLEVADSRENYSGHADIKFLLAELKAREPGEPLTPEAQKKFKDMKDALLLASNYMPDPNPQTASWQGGKLEPPRVFHQSARA
jgi:hypothetical protein